MHSTGARRMCEDRIDERRFSVDEIAEPDMTLVKFNNHFRDRMGEGD